VECVGGELGGVSLGGSEAADGSVDSVDVDEGGVEGGGAVDYLGDGCRSRLRCTATLSVKADLTKAPLGD
jgi:hypothetical protein